jgi:hypothetical protein
MLQREPSEVVDDDGDRTNDVHGEEIGMVEDELRRCLRDTSSHCLVTGS